MTALAGWENFYVVGGSSAGALIGLQFVVMALIADMPRTPGQAQAGHARLQRPPLLILQLCRCSQRL
jgi:hypothetical protein